MENHNPKSCRRFQSNSMREGTSSYFSDSSPFLDTNTCVVTYHLQNQNIELNHEIKIKLALSMSENIMFIVKYNGKCKRCRPKVISYKTIYLTEFQHPWDQAEICLQQSCLFSQYIYKYIASSIYRSCYGCPEGRLTVKTKVGSILDFSFDIDTDTGQKTSDSISILSISVE